MRAEFLLVVLSMVMIAVAIPFMIRSILWGRVLKYLHKGMYDKVLQLLNGKLFTLFFSAYDRRYNCLRVHLARSDSKQIEAQLQTLLEMKLSEQQAYQIASQSYFYFLEKENKVMCEQLLAFMEKKEDKDILSYHHMLFRVMIEKKCEDIGYLEKMLEDKEHEKVKKDQLVDHQIQIGLLQYLLGLQYAYARDTKQMQAYLSKAKTNVKGTPYAKKVKQLLSHK